MADYYGIWDTHQKVWYATPQGLWTTTSRTLAIAEVWNWEHGLPGVKVGRFEVRNLTRWVVNMEKDEQRSDA